AYGYNGSSFLAQDVGLDDEPAYRGSMTLGDIDGDGDLDLLQTGLSGSGTITQMYTSTLTQYAGEDGLPLPSNSLVANYLNGTLRVNWSQGSDGESPSQLLRYVLRVGSVNESDRFMSGLGSPQ